MKRRILYIHMCALGDAIMASPALRILHRGLPDAEIHVLARRAACDYFGSLDSVATVIPFAQERFVDRRSPWKLLLAPRQLAELYGALRRNRYDAAIQWRGQIPDTLMNFATGAPVRIAGVQSIHRPSAIPVERVSFLVTDLVATRAPDAHLVEAMSAPARFAVTRLGGVPGAEPQALEYPISARDAAEALAFRQTHRIANRPYAIVATSAKTTVNSWPPDRFARVADHLQQRYGYQVVLSGLPEHRHRELEVTAAMRTQPICSTGRIPFGALCGVLQHARILVCLNTGISHVAAALRVPTVVLSGRDGASITPWHAPHRIVTRNSYYPMRHPDPRDWPKLVGRISAAEVNGAVDELLGERHG